MTKKKSSFGRIIFILILLLILVGGGYFGYKYYSEGNTSTSTNFDGKDFQIEGTWYVSDIDAGFGDGAFNFIEYTFERPANAEGKWTGKVNVVSNDLGNPTRTGSYEIVDKNKLIISFPNEMDYEFAYTHYPDEQKLEMDFVGQKRMLVRAKPVVEQTPAPQTEAEIKIEEEKIQTQLWMDNIADVEWKEFDTTDGFTRVVKFNKPVQEGDIIKGEFEWVTDEHKHVYEYERVSDGEVKFTPIKYFINGVEQSNPESSGILIMKLLDDGNTLILENPSYRIWKFKR